MKFIRSHVQLISKSNSEESINIHSFLTKLETNKFAPFFWTTVYTDECASQQTVTHICKDQQIQNSFICHCFNNLEWMILSLCDSVNTACCISINILIDWLIDICLQCSELLIGRQEEIRPVRCWWWLSVCSKVQTVRIWSSWHHCIPKRHHLLPHLNPDWFYHSGTGLPRLSWKRGH